TIDVTADGSALALGSGQVSVALAVGVTIADNTIANQIRAVVDGSAIDSAGAVTVAAESSHDIDSENVAIAVAASQGKTFALALAGSQSRADNTVQNTVEAAVKAGAAVAATGAVQVL